jgi:hypothetical protein
VAPLFTLPLHLEESQNRHFYYLLTSMYKR